MDELLKHWEILASVGSTLILFGKQQQVIQSLKERVGTVEKDQKEQAKDLTQVRVDVAEIKSTVKAIYDQVRK